MNVPCQKNRNRLALTGTICITKPLSSPYHVSIYQDNSVTLQMESTCISKLIVYPPYVTKNCRTKDLPKNSAKMESQVYFAFVSKCHVSNCNYSAFTVQLTLFARVFNLYQPQIMDFEFPCTAGWCPYFNFRRLTMNRELITGLATIF